MEIPNVRREARYGIPAADQIVYNRHYILGYSYYFRQAKWVLEIISPNDPLINRKDIFRPDYRIPEMFRADLVDYAGSGYSRGHLVASADQKESKLGNSETFLLSNMSPQNQAFNGGIWQKLENAVRRLNNKDSVLETYVVTGPIFDFYKDIVVIGKDDTNPVTIPVPHYYFKAILAEDDRGKLHMYSFMIPNEKSNLSLERFQVPTTLIENWAGIKLWSTLTGTEIEKEKAGIELWTE